MTSHLSTVANRLRRYHPLCATSAILIATGLAVGGVAGTSQAASDGSTAPGGTVNAVGRSSFTVHESSGTDVSIDVIVGSTYNVTKRSSVSAAKDGEWAEAVGSEHGTTLDATALALVPEPPARIPHWVITSSPGGEEFYGRIVAHHGNTITISNGSERRTIVVAAGRTVTRTLATTLQAVKVGETVEVDGPQESTYVWTGHQINLGVKPAVVGQPGVTPHLGG